MSNPSILQSLYVKKVSDREYGVFTKSAIFRNSVVEYCAWIPVTQKTQIILGKNQSSVTSKLFKNSDAVERENEVRSKITEFELQKRLENGSINPQQFQALLIEMVNPNQWLELETHGILLGYGSIYRKSDRPNVTWEYDKQLKLYKFITVEDIRPEHELTYFSN